jgi:hypothetical protein
MTSVSGTAAAASGPNGYSAGTIDKLDIMLVAYAAEYGSDSMECWWRDDLDALVPMLPRSVLLEASCGTRTEQQKGVRSYNISRTT